MGARPDPATAGQPSRTPAQLLLLVLRAPPVERSMEVKLPAVMERLAATALADDVFAISDSAVARARAREVVDAINRAGGWAVLGQGWSRGPR